VILLIAQWRGKCAHFVQGRPNRGVRCTASSVKRFVYNDLRRSDFAAQLARLLRPDAVLG
jgi:hypothetical protein